MSAACAARAPVVREYSLRAITDGKNAICSSVVSDFWSLDWLWWDLWTKRQSNASFFASSSGMVEMDGELGCRDRLRRQSIVVLNSSEDRESDQPPVSLGRLL